MTDKYPGGHIEYLFEMHVNHRESIHCKIDDSRIKEIIIKKLLPDDQFDNKWQLIITCSEVSSIEEVDCIGAENKNGIINLLSFMLKTSVNNISRTGHGIIPREGECAQCHVIMPALTCHAVGKSGGRKLNESEIHGLGKLLIRSKSLKDNPLVNIFSYAIQIEEPVVQFMLLYLIIYEIYKDQKSVDKFIMQVAPNTIQVTSPHNKKQETIFTKLRNEITHRVGTPPDDTRNGIIGNLHGLREIAHTAIMSQII